MQQNTAISLNNISKIYRIYKKPADRLKQSIRRNKQYFREYCALLPIDLKVNKGETVGVIGSNGSGKSTLLQIIAGTLNPSSGSLTVNGRISALLELGAGFNPAFSGHDNIYLSGSIMGLSKTEINNKYDEIIAFSGLSKEAVMQEVSTYSSGMYVRLAFATAIAVNPEILIVDEALAVGDEGFQRKCFAKIKQLQANGATIFFVSHSAKAVIDLCDHAILLDKGELLMQGKPANVVASYHNMLFAPETEKAEIRKKIQNQIELDSSDELSKNSTHQNLQKCPETQIIYPNDGGIVTQWRATDEHNNPCFIWENNKNYYIKYMVELTEDVNNLRCSIMIKTITGLEFAGTLWHGDKDKYHKGDKLEMSFVTNCKFSKGDYFINIGVVQEEYGNYRFISRIVDAIHIKVIENEEEKIKNQMQSTGLIDAEIKANCLLFN